MGVAMLGLAVNVLSAWLLARSGQGHPGHDHGHGGHGHAAHDHEEHDHAEHDHGRDHDHDHDHAGHGHDHAPHGHAQHHDQNFRAAYVHVLADAVTSLLAIGALGGGLLFGWAWLDPAVALVGAAVIGQWAYSVLRTSARGLVDATADPAISRRIRELVEADRDAQVADLHVWQVGARAWSAAISVVADQPLAAESYRARLLVIERLRHVTIEVHRCPGESPG
jgi:cation diffusion facilitator family transporter